MQHFDKVSLGLFPTPMYRLPNISRELGTNVWIKRDDLCGVALGGNKVRKLEYLLQDAKKQGYDLVMTTGQAQSTGGSQHGMVALGLSGGHHQIIALILGIPEQIVQLPDLIAAQGHAAQVIPLDPDIGAQLPADIWQPVHGGGKQSQGLFFKMIHGNLLA